ncbi:MAG: type II secretion system F family protein [Pseudomonadota bacterium]
MLSLIYDSLTNPQSLLILFTAIAVAATIFTVAIPLLERDALQNRMKVVSTEREKIRARERARLEMEKKRGSLRNADAKSYMQQLVDRFNLRKALADDNTGLHLKQAGYRGQAPIVVFLFARFVLPFIAFFLALFYVFVVMKLEQPLGMKLAICACVAGVGFFLPNIWVKNQVAKRQLSIKRAWPDALDLMLICVESGMSIEMAFKRVAREIGTQSIALAEELTLTTAELSYLQERRLAYDNLALRTGVEGVKAAVMALTQAERYGTPLGHTLRVMADENRELRMIEAEKKAAALPPKLTVPMIVFFLPVLFVVIMGPAVMKVTSSNLL